MSTSVEKAEEVIQQIASENGVVISKDDPIMILYTINQILASENKKVQEQLLDNFKSQMEVISDKWSTEAKNHSDRILNSSIVSSQAEVARIMEEQSSVIVEKWKYELNTGFSEVHETIHSSRQSAILNILASLITLTAAVIVFYVFITM